MNLSIGKSWQKPPFGKHVYFWRGKALQIMGRWPTFLSRKMLKEEMLTDSTINVYFETINQPILVGFLEWCLWHLQSRWWFQPKHRGVVDPHRTKMRCWTRNRWVVGCASMILLGMFLLIPHVDFPKKTLKFLLGTDLGWSFFFWWLQRNWDKLKKQGGDMCGLGFGDMEGWVVVTHNETLLGTQKHYTNWATSKGLAWPFPASFGGLGAISFPPNWTPATSHKKWLTSTKVTGPSPKHLESATWKPPKNPLDSLRWIHPWPKTFVVLLRALWIGAWCGSPKIANHGRGFGDLWCSFSPVHFETI